MHSDEMVLDILKQCGALKEGHFVLASGKHSGHYVQVGQLCQYPDRLETVLKETSKEFAELDFKSFVSAAIGGITVGQQLALIHGKRHVFCERKDNIMLLRRGFTFEPGEKIVLVEDVMTTGGTVKEIQTVVEAAGAKVVAIFSLVNRSGVEAGTWEGSRFVRSINIQFPVYEADKVPEQLAAVAVTRPGSKKVTGEV
jgi:orotate phosphoribosyltransferase